MEVDEAGRHYQSASADDPFPANTLGRDGAQPLAMPTLATASGPVSGSMTRPPSMTASYSWALAVAPQAHQNHEQN
jgi:hypothetical protein